MTTGRQVAERWLALKLKSLGVQVHRHPAPDSTVYPHLTIGLLTGRDIRSMGDAHGVERLTYDVSAWDKGSSALKVNRLAARVFATIDGITETIEWTDEDGPHKGTILDCRRIGVVPITSTIEDGERYERDGGQYVIDVLTR